MGREDARLSAAKRAYKNAKAEGSRQEEARWANVIGDILKNRGEYVEALKWLRIDYEVSIKYLPQKHLLPTCQSLGEVYLRLEHFKDALVYQKKHLELAKDANDLIEQQRASTQLGRTYHEMFLRSEDDHFSVQNAKKYFKSAMKLAQTLKENPPTHTTSFLKEYIDAHNNIGMLEMDLDNLEEARNILTKGLQICDEEEVIEDDDGRSRLHHNLGNVYMELRLWDKAREHIEKDIIICKRIGHCQGEAKGYINLGELHYRVQKYQEAIRCYQKALDLAKSMEDEDALAGQIDKNIETVKEAMAVMDQLKNEEQNLKKMTRNMVTVKWTSHERKCLLEQNASLDRLIEKSSLIFAWLKHREFAKRKKRVAKELCDKEKLSDSFLVIGESYRKLRDFKKAIKWYTKSLEFYKSIGNLEGQALAKINIGDALDCDGDWTQALDSFEEGYRIAVKANLPSVQLSALENMHYSHMIRFDNVEEARRLQLVIEGLKQTQLKTQNMSGDCCSETDTEGDRYMSDSKHDACWSPKRSKSSCSESKSMTDAEGSTGDVPLISLLKSNKSLPNNKGAHVNKCKASIRVDASPKVSSKLSGDQAVGGRKRVRVVLSDDECEMQSEGECLRQKGHKYAVEDVATSDEFKSKNSSCSGCRYQDSMAVTAECATDSANCINIEESICSHKSTSLQVVAQSSRDFRSSSTEEGFIPSHRAASGSKCDSDIFENLQHNHNAVHLKLHTAGDDNHQCIAFKIEDDLICVEAGFCVGATMSIDSLKVELACLYLLRLSQEKRSNGLLPIIRHMKCSGRTVESLDMFAFEGNSGRPLVEVFIDGWVQKRLMMLYVDCCKELSEPPNMNLLKKLYNAEVEDEVIASDCELQDVSVTPLFNALHHKTIAMLDLSHNLLGNGTMEKLKQFFTSSSQSYGDLTLDLHCNRFGPTALFQICECPVLFARLEVLNISGNHLTDSCGSYLTTILQNCKALYSLNIERCSITSRTIQKVADALDAGSVLAQLSIGYNCPVSSNAIINLVAKLSTLKSFSDFNLSGLKLRKPVVDSLCQLSKASYFSRLMLEGADIGTDLALQLTESLASGNEESVKLDLSYCGITSTYTEKLSTDVSLFCGILELNLGGNPITQEGCNALASVLMSPQCNFKVLVLNKCQLGLAGVLQIIQALAENKCLEELRLAENSNLDLHHAPHYDLKKGSSETTQPMSMHSPKAFESLVHNGEQGPCAVNTDCSELEVVDSEDNALRASALNGSCMSSCQRNSSFECQFIEELSRAIGMIKQLKLLDLSQNGFSAESAGTLYTAWSLGSRSAFSCRHIEDQTIHLSVIGNKCCGVKPCCKKD